MKRLPVYCDGDYYRLVGFAEQNGDEVIITIVNKDAIADLSHDDMRGITLGFIKVLRDR